MRVLPLLVLTHILEEEGLVEEGRHHALNAGHQRSVLARQLPLIVLS